MQALSHCSLCRRRERAVVYASESITVCALCARGVARLFLTTETSTLQQIWGIEARRDPAAMGGPSMPASPVVSDADAHADLAAAYAEMGLVPEAFAAAARSLLVEDRAAPREHALSVLLGPIPRSAVAELRTLVFDPD